MEGEYQGICCLFSERAGQEPNSLYTQDSTGHIGFQFKEGKITSIVVDSSAARSFLLRTVLQKKKTETSCIQVFPLCSCSCNVLILKEWAAYRAPAAGGERPKCGRGEGQRGKFQFAF